ncbi:protein unc-13 homolog [Magnolia sinica]|uniref:protein unc-13 homolog n=1 Tax=Magnolia sinica TaxID=86752 RepID=UPI00265826A3|nr:protein unc-13 homolog [Magnolia sinica]
MGHHSRRDSLATSSISSSTTITSRSEFDLDTELEWPFGKVDIDRDDLRESAYELFFTACRSSPGFGGRNALTYYPAAGAQDNGNKDESCSSPKSIGLGMVVTSRIKRALGLKMMKRSSPRRSHSHSNSSPRENNGPPSPAPLRIKRPMTSAELMRQQMRVTEQGDNRLRKTLMRTLVGQMGRRAETIILPLELLRHLKPSEFNDAHEYYIWQRRQLKVLEEGLLVHPSIVLDRSNPSAMRLREITRMSESKAIDTGKNSETMRALCNAVVTLAWRSPSGAPTDACHWADGFPLNLHLYIILLQSIFDLKDETTVLDEVDELIELMKKTWSTLGINRSMHNVCFTWVLFEQFVMTGQVEHDLLCACLTMMAELANDAKRPDREVLYVKILSATLASMQGWAEKRLLDYHEWFQKGAMGSMENILPLALSAAKILDEDVSSGGGVLQEKENDELDSRESRVDYYIRSSMRNAFAKILENGNSNNVAEEDEDHDDPSKTLILLAKEAEDLAMKEKETFSCVLKRWLPNAAGVAAVTLHNCYGVMLKQYLTGVLTLNQEAVRVLQTAGKLEKVLVQMVVEDSVECEDGGKAIVREMVPYEVESIILNLMKTWVDEMLKRGRDCLERAKETETWNPKSKTEAYAQSAVEIMRLAKETVDGFFEIPVGGICDDVLQDLADGLESLLQDYITFVASCGSKQSYVPSLPPLTRCNQDSKILKLWRKASPCRAVGPDGKNGSTEGNHPRPSTSRGTQRLYIRLNTLHYLLTHIHSLDKSLSLSPRPTPDPRSRFPNNRRRLSASSSYFDLARSAISSATQYVSEVAAYRLIFLDSNSVFYDSLYVGDVANARIRPALRTLKQNLTLLSAILTDRSQPLAVKEVMKASFESFLMVMLAGGSSRMFVQSDYDMVLEDFASLKRVFCTCGEGLVAEEVVEREAEVVEGVVTLMGQGTDQLIEDFSIVACEASGLGLTNGGSGSGEQKMPMPPTTGRFNQADPNTILRVLCYRNDTTANSFLKRTFQLPKRR